MQGIMLCGSLLLLALGMYGQEYAASDDGRIVYFSGRPVTGSIDAGSRLWTWSEGKIRTVIETTADESVRLERLSYDGQTFLVSYGSTGGTVRWQVWRRGAAAPMYEVSDPAVVSMSRNGNWLAVLRTWPSGSIARMAVTSGGVRPAGNLSYSIRATPVVGISGSGTVHFPCATEYTTCAWDGEDIVAPLPPDIPLDVNGRFLYYWDNTGTSYLPTDQTLIRSDRQEGKTAALQVQCPKVFVQSRILPSSTWYASQAEIHATDESGLKVLYRCGDRRVVYNSGTGTSTAAPAWGVFDSSLARVLSRPAPTSFAWVALNAPVEPLDTPDSIRFEGPTNPRGVLTYKGVPDFTIEWGGQTLSWIPGNYGAAYAAMPGDAVPGAVDTVSITSATRPWLNFTMRIPVSGVAAVAVPPAVDAMFIHGDYRGFVTLSSPAERGEYLHFLVSGIEPQDIAPGTAIEATYWTRPNQQNGLRSPYFVTLPVVALRPTPYHPLTTQVTFYIPPDARGAAGAVDAGSFRLQLRTADGTRIPSAEFFGYLGY